MAECLCCEREYLIEDSSATLSKTYCTAECETLFGASLKESATSSKVIGLIDDEGNSILGGAYQQAIERTIRVAAAGVGIKFPPKGD